MDISDKMWQRSDSTWFTMHCLIAYEIKCVSENGNIRKKKLVNFHLPCPVQIGYLKFGCSRHFEH